MKQEIIDLMQSNLGSGTWAYKDFEIDKAHLENYDGPFFWSSRENGTSLTKLDIDHINRMVRNENPNLAETNRFCLFQDFYVFLNVVLYWSEMNANLFYYNGNVLMKVNQGQAKEIYRDVLTPVYHELKREFMHEYKMANKKLPIKFTCPLSKVKEALSYAESIGDTSLLDCLHRLRTYKRNAIDQYIEIGSDFTKHGFVFAELRNGECRMNGGIILHDYMKENRWSIHT